MMGHLVIGTCCRSFRLSWAEFTALWCLISMRVYMYVVPHSAGTAIVVPAPKFIAPGQKEIHEYGPNQLTFKILSAKEGCSSYFNPLYRVVK